MGCLHKQGSCAPSKLRCLYNPVLGHSGLDKAARYVCLFFEVKTLESDFMDARQTSCVVYGCQSSLGRCGGNEEPIFALDLFCSQILYVSRLFQAMREIVDRYFGDSWVVAYALGPALPCIDE